MKRSQPSRVNGGSGPPFLLDADASIVRGRLGQANIQDTMIYAKLTSPKRDAGAAVDQAVVRDVAEIPGERGP